MCLLRALLTSLSIQGVNPPPLKKEVRGFNRHFDFHFLIDVVFVFSCFFILFFSVPCGRLRCFPASFWAHADISYFYRIIPSINKKQLTLQPGLLSLGFGLDLAKMVLITPLITARHFPKRKLAYDLYVYHTSRNKCFIYRHQQQVRMFSTLKRNCLVVKHNGKRKCLEKDISWGNMLEGNNSRQMS